MWTFKEKLFIHCRRILVLIFDILLDHNQFYSILGWMRKNFGWPDIQTVFLMYPEDIRYALAFVYPSRLSRVKWRPFLAGFFRQNKRLGLMFAVSATPQDFRDGANLEHMKLMVQRMEDIRKRTGASRKTFAGILPGILFTKRIVREAPEAELTVQAVVQAIQQIRTIEQIPDSGPIIVLGGRGFIGRRLVKKLRTMGHHVISLDKNDTWPVLKNHEPTLVINVASKNALMDYKDHLKPNMVVINEAYPPPPVRTVQHFGVTLYHIKGVKAWAVPPFPHAYRGGIPCCAAFFDPQMQVLVDQLIGKGSIN